MFAFRYRAIRFPSKIAWSEFAMLPMAAAAATSRFHMCLSFLAKRTVFWWGHWWLLRRWCERSHAIWSRSCQGQCGWNVRRWCDRGAGGMLTERPGPSIGSGENRAFDCDDLVRRYSLCTRIEHGWPYRDAPMRSSSIPGVWRDRWKLHLLLTCWMHTRQIQQCYFWRFERNI